MKNHVDVSYILPCYNEGDTLERSILELVDILESMCFGYELIFIDDKSTDQTLDILNSVVPSLNSKARILTNSKNCGRGETVCRGIREATGDIVGFLDIDLEVHPTYIPRFISCIQKGADIAIAWRSYQVRLSTLFRWITNVGYQALRRNLVGPPMHDTEAGFKFFKRERILPVMMQTVDNHWFWDTEIIVHAYRAGLKIVEVPVLFVRRQEKKSTVKPLKDSLYYFHRLLLFSYKLSQSSKHSQHHG